MRSLSLVSIQQSALWGLARCSKVQTSQRPGPVGRIPLSDSMRLVCDFDCSKSGAVHTHLTDQGCCMPSPPPTRIRFASAFNGPYLTDLFVERVRPPRRFFLGQIRNPQPNTRPPGIPARHVLCLISCSITSPRNSIESN